MPLSNPVGFDAMPLANADERNPPMSVYSAEFNTVRSNGVTYSQADLRRAFEEMEDKTNWKNPFRAEIPADKIPLYSEAAIHFTGGGFKVVGHFTKPDGSNWVTVEGHGYYFHVGA